jgi:hypothetical protein
MNPKTSTFNVLQTECDCEKCRSMCKSPCCGTIEDIQKLIDAGYGDRLMVDDWPGDTDLIKPAMKGSEGHRAPWETTTEEGCTFWKDGKCELHNLGLKPTQGKLAHHDNKLHQVLGIEDLIRDSWEDDNAKEFIEKWKKEFMKEEEDEQDDDIGL